jgi:hypothetical protein
MTNESKERRHKKEAMKRWPLFSIAGICLVLIVARVIWPELKIDSTSLILLGIATVALLVALLPITHIKWGDFEADIDRALDSVEKKVLAIEMDAAAKPPVTEPPKRIELQEPQRPQKADAQLNKETRGMADEFLSLVMSPISDSEKILGATILLGAAIGKVANVLDPDRTYSKGNLQSVINRLTYEGFLTSSEEKAFMEMLELRNLIVHEGHAPNSEQTARFLDILWRLIQKLP